MNDKERAVIEAARAYTARYGTQVVGSEGMAIFEAVRALSRAEWMVEGHQVRGGAHGTVVCLDGFLGGHASLARRVCRLLREDDIRAEREK